ncbi:MAG: hypothetical protein QM724_12505 [Flavobacteriales bacterium]
MAHRRAKAIFGRPPRHTMPTSRSPYILSTSSNLIGLCLIVMTSLKIADHTAASVLDEFTGVAAVLLMSSCLLSFLSIRTAHPQRSERIERWADITFLGGLAMVFLTIVLVAFHFLV